MSARERHVVFGAGQVGSHLAALLSARGHDVAVVSRSGRATAHDVTNVAGDAMDRSFCASVVHDAAVAYHCMNPKYELAAWQAQLPQIQSNLVATCGDAGVRLVVLDNIYGLGRTGGAPMTEDTPLRPCSRKGEVRARLAEDLLAACRRGSVSAVIGRASDFFGPGGLQTMFEERFWRRVLAGKSAQVVVPPDTLHTYHYIPDVAAALATLAMADEADMGRAWMLPCAPAVSTREFIGLIGRALGHDVPISVMPRWIFAALKLVVPIFRELDEMLYQWDEAFVVDDQRFRARFGTAATPLDEAARQSVAWARERFGTG